MPESKPNKISTPFAICATHVPAYTVSSRRKRLPLGLTVFAALVLSYLEPTRWFSFPGALNGQKKAATVISRRQPQPSMMRSLPSTFLFQLLSQTQKKKIKFDTRQREKKIGFNSNPDDHPENIFNGILICRARSHTLAQESPSLSVPPP